MDAQDRITTNVFGWDFDADTLDPTPTDEFEPDFDTSDLSDAVMEGSL